MRTNPQRAVWGKWVGLKSIRGNENQSPAPDLLELYTREVYQGK
ncbi:Uncharacterised protein [Corynebacterium amycolatum]|nr:Uncharacterised protein [Corynebacterium amycolatum]